MGITEKRMLGVAGAGLIMGAIGDLLLRSTPWGVNITIWTAAFLVAAAVLAVGHRMEIKKEALWLLPPIALFAAGFAWRDSNTLKVLNGMGICAALALAALRSRSGRLVIGGVMEYSLGLLKSLLSSVPAFSGALGKAGKSLQFSDTHSRGKVLAIVRGLVISVPLLLVFGKLFVDADAAFERLIGDLFNWDISELFVHLCWIILCGAIAGGLLYRVLISNELAEPTYRHSPKFSLGIIEVAVVLFMLNLLFIGFIGTQISYFFGGSEMVTATQSLTISAYARRGFFELVTVTLLILPLLLLSHWLLRVASPRDPRIFNGLAGTLVAMLFVVMASAIHRMYLYQNSYGLTELRLYTTVFMGWLALVFLWFMHTVLRGERVRFAFGALAAGFAIIILLDAINPDGLIVRINTGRAIAGKEVDICYLATLSDDAIPRIIDALPQVKPSVRGYVAGKLLASLPARDKGDWRSWNWGAALALDRIKRNQTALEEMTRITPPVSYATPGLFLD